MRKVVILASGSGTLAKAIFSAEKDYQVVALICDRANAPVIQVALSFGIPVELLEHGNDRQIWNQRLFELVAVLKPDLVVSAGFMRILAAQFVQTFKVINSHPALLPLFPGAHAVRDALAARSVRTGTTIHWVDEGVDTGKIIAQLELEILPSDDENSLHERIKIIERSLIVETIPQVLANLK